MSQSLIRLPEVQRRTGYSKAWIYRLMAEQRFLIHKDWFSSNRFH